MFNQKINGYTSENAEYLNHSIGAPYISAREIHNCGTTIQKYTKPKSCSSLPLQTWCSKNVAVESFAMRPIVNSKEYFENIKSYLSSIIYTDSVNLKNSNLTKENYSLFSDYGYEPESSFLQTINLEVSDKLSYLMSASSDQISIFSNFNPICEGFVITDIDINTYKSNQNPNHFFHRVLFSAFNTTRYNTISFKAELYQDTSPMMQNWNKSINQVENSQNVGGNISNSVVYLSMIDLTNNTNCVLGQESDCAFKAHTFSSFSQLLNDNFLEDPTGISWIQPDAITKDKYTINGNYDNNGNISIVDYGPSNINELIKNLKV